jgi:hypothetical protein
MEMALPSPFFLHLTMPRIAVIVFVFLLFSAFVSCNKPEKGMTLVSPKHTGINYKNTIQDSDSFNIISEENIYNGAGVGIGDFNNDGRQDIFFSGNQVSNALYLNQGGFRFRDVSEAAGIQGAGQWGRGVAVVDINQDGLLDIYVCSTLLNDSTKLANQLYVNQGKNADSVPVFKEMAKAYGLDDKGHTTMSAFFDYDNDGDLDVYLVTNKIFKKAYPNTYAPVLKDGSHPNTDRLYRNEGSDSLGHPFYKDVSVEAGIRQEGYGHGINILDINEDGWEDIYVTNDYISSNLLWINNKNGTFTESVKHYLDHSSANAMGVDVADLNNDLLPDILELDMNSEDNLRKKMFLNGNNYSNYVNTDLYGLHYQYVRNVLNVNLGRRVGANDSLGDPVFSDISFFSGIAETDWSWAPLIVDFDDDGLRDIFISNGFPKDVTDHDFISYRNQAFSIATMEMLLSQIPEVKIPNYIYHNKGAMHFDNVTTQWGLTAPSFSNGAAYADLDNDGDMDLVVSNINDHPFVYQNNIHDTDTSHNYLNIMINGAPMNNQGFGARVKVFAGSLQQYTAFTPYRGYLSSNQPVIHFGLGNTKLVDSVKITWPGGKEQVLYQVPANQTITLNHRDARNDWVQQSSVFAGAPIVDISAAAGNAFSYLDDDFVDFNIQKLLPRKFSEQGPGLASADLDGNGTDDVVMGGSIGKSPMVFFQDSQGRFNTKEILPGSNADNKPWEDVGICLVDIDNDGDMDIYTSSGGYENISGAKAYTDHLYTNDGSGKFTMVNGVVPASDVSKSAVRSVDYDQDGDEDLIIAGRLKSWEYPKVTTTTILRNDSKDGKVVLTDVTSTVAPRFQNIGLISDISITDIDNDRWPDIVLAGDWMPIKIFKNKAGKFEPVSQFGSLSKLNGWWTSILSADFDNDGDMDLVVGNTGLNSFYRPSEKYPVHLYHADFDNNGSYDAYLGVYLKQKIGDTKRILVPAHTREDMIKQMIQTRDRFKTYEQYANTNAMDVVTADQMAKGTNLNLTTLASCYLQNNGKGSFEVFRLPDEAQYAPIYGMMAEDVDNDGFLDLIMTGNDYGTDVSIGRYDASKGLVLKGNGKGGFIPMAIAKSGMYTYGDCRSMIKIRHSDQKFSFLVGRNKTSGILKKMITSGSSYNWQKSDRYAWLISSNGSKRKVENHSGQSYLSQSAPFLFVNSYIKSLVVVDSHGVEKKIF